MKKRIILLVDFSKYTTSVMQMANMLSTQLPNIEMIMMHKLTLAAPALTDNQTKEELLDIERKKAFVELKELKDAYLPNISKLGYYVSDTPLPISIAEHKHPDYQDIIIMGLKGSGLLKKVFIGSTNVAIMEQLNIPIISLPAEFAITQKWNLVLGVNYRFPVNLDKLKSVMDFISGSIDKMYLLSVLKMDENEQDASEYLFELAKEMPKKVKVSARIIQDENAIETMKSYFKSVDGNLLMLQKGSRSLKDQLFRKFVINELIYEGKTALITLP
jgi:hypothetical protein